MFVDDGWRATGRSVARHPFVATKSMKLLASVGGTIHD